VSLSFCLLLVLDMLICVGSLESFVFTTHEKQRAGVAPCVQPVIAHRADAVDSTRLAACTHLTVLTLPTRNPY